MTTDDGRRTTDTVESRTTHHASRITFHVSSYVFLFHIALTLAQVVFFGQVVAEGRALDVTPLPEPVYRVDGLGLVLGVGWCVAVALSALSMRDAPRESKWAGVFACLVTVGMLNAFYARLPLLLYLGWELAGLGLWLTLRRDRPANKFAGYGYKARLRGLLGQTDWVLHISGWPLLVAILVGSIVPFAPPVGGVASAWAMPVTVALGVVALIRGGCAPFDGWMRTADAASNGRYTPLLALYAVSAPMLLAKMLVAAPWDPGGAWALALIGMAALSGSVISPLFRDRGYSSLTVASIFSAAAIVGFALSPGSPIASAGAIALMLCGMVGVTVMSRDVHPGSLGVANFPLLLGALPGVWLLSQGALGLGYGVVAAVLLSAIAAVIVLDARRSVVQVGATDEGGSRVLGLHPIQAPTNITQTPNPRPPTPILIGAALLVLSAVYPQALVEFVLKPAVGAMAGGVGALSMLMSDWGVGVSVASPQGATLAALPATGIAVAVFLAWVALYWLRQIIVRVLPTKLHETESE
jgi:hypothetical protein